MGHCFGRLEDRGKWVTVLGYGKEWIVVPLCWDIYS